jgi:hypothetical protein
MNDDRELIEGLRRLAEDTVVPPVDPAQEQRLLAAFDAHWTPRRTSSHPSRLARLPVRSGRTLMATGLLAAAAALVWMVQARSVVSTRTPPQIRPVVVQQVEAMPLGMAKADPPPAPVATPRSARVRRPQPRPAGRDRQGFIMWPGADDLPRFESGQLMRVELPASVAISLGLRPPRPLRNDGVVQSDVLVGQDGYARAVRLVQ